MKLSLALVCDEARERPDGRLDVSGIFDELSAPGFPAIQARLTVVFVMHWEADEEGSQAFRADLIFEDETRVLTIEGGTDLPPAAGRTGTPRTRLVLPLEKVVFPRPGHYRFELMAGGDVHIACPLLLRELPAATPTRAAGTA